MKLSAETKIHEVLTAYPFLEESLAKQYPKFAALRKNPVARATLGRVATLRAAASMAGIDLEALIGIIAGEIAKHTGAAPEQASAQTPPPLTREQRLEALSGIIRDLHAGGDLEQARRRFAAAVGDVEASEIAAMEEALIRGGLPVSEVQRLCDVHVGAFREALDEHASAQTPPGHPVHTYQAANRIIGESANRLGQLAREAEAGAVPGQAASPGLAARLAEAVSVLDRLGGVENHYQRKENQLFPLLERRGVTGPTQVMWGVHDEIRARLKAVRDAARRGDARAFADAAPGLARDLTEMIYKEEKVLFPMALQTLSESEWAEIRRGEDVLGYVLVQPTAAWPAGSETSVPPGAASPQLAGAPPAAPPAPSAGASALFELATGALSPEQVNLLLTHLPLDLSFVDETDTVRYYSDSPERIFPRSPGIIGRKVQNCHPPKSVHTVQTILDSFRAGDRDVAEFWIEMQGRFIHIRYIAVRDKTRAYHGCLEVSQDVTHIRALQGERRLLDWD